ncbi:MAG: hypothetical protein JKY65_00370 [Planctomycetes bacterium]|nr:hypothetical protein [Planctomycetota bacterium]
MRPALPTALAFSCCALLACQSGPEHTEEAPAELATALGALDLGPKTPTEDDPRSLLAYDFEPFVQAGLTDAGPTLSGLLRGLMSARAAATNERLGEVQQVGHVLAIRAEPQTLGLAKSFLARLEREKTQPISLDLHLVVVADGRLGFLDAKRPRPLNAAFLKQLDKDLAAGTARTLMRRRLRLTPGKRRSIHETTSRRPVVRITLENGLPVAQQETVEDGIALHATCWLAGGGYVMTHLEFAAQQQAPTGQDRTLAASFRLPVTGKESPRPKVKAAIDLPRVRLTGLRTQARLERGRWQVVAAGPSVDAGHRLVALVRADWSQDPGGAIKGAARGHEIRSLRVALLQRGGGLAEERAAQKSVFFGTSMLGGRTQNVLGGLKSEYTRQSSVSVRNDIGFGRQLIDATKSRHTWSAPGQTRSQGLAWAESWTPLLPAKLDEQNQAFARIRWGASTKLLLAWDQLHVVHSPAAIRELQGLVKGVESWRNRPLQVRAEWLSLSPAEADALRDPAKLAAALPNLRTRRVFSPYFLNTRSGAWSELSHVENEGVLWGFFGDDRPSPEVRFVPRGSRLSVRPRRYGSGRIELKLRFAHDQAPARSLTPVARAEGLIHKPQSRQSQIEQVLSMKQGEPRLLLAGAAPSGGRVQALVVTCWY